MSQDTVDTKTFHEALIQHIKEATAVSDIHKQAFRRMLDVENTLDAEAVEVKAEEGQKKRKKSVNIDVDELLRAPSEDIMVDLNGIHERESIPVFIEDATLHYKDGQYSKGTRVKAVLHGEDFHGIVVSVAEDSMTIRTKDMKRVRVQLDDLRIGNATVAAAHRKEKA